jgi:DNA-binding winged helix-turn-helix (wHTH) protein
MRESHAARLACLPTKVRAVAPEVPGFLRVLSGIAGATIPHSIPPGRVLPGRAPGTMPAVRARKVRVHSGDWVLDTATRQVERVGDVVHVSPKAFDLLTVLLLERPRAVSKAELLRRLWPDVVVSEVNLTCLAAEVRSALGDEARRPRYVRTVPRYGYAFCGATTEDDPKPVVVKDGTPTVRLETAERDVLLAPGAHLLGRQPEAAVRIDSGAVSRRHAVVTVSDGGASIEDLGSKNGTFVNRERVCGVRPLSDGDEIRLGPVRLVFRLSPVPPTTESEAG